MSGNGDDAPKCPEQLAAEARSLEIWELRGRAAGLSWADERQGYLVPWVDGTVICLGDAVAAYAAEVATSILMDFTTDYPDITMTFDRWDNLREIIKERMEDGFPLDVVGAKPR